MINRQFVLAIALALVSVPALLLAFPSASALWQSETTSDGSSITKRHETGSVVVNGNLYVLGGRRLLPVEVYKPSTDGWESLGLGPIEMHHFQPVAVGSKIYAIGAMTCCFPDEPSIADIHVFDTANSTWSIDGQIPTNRLRGGAGAVVYKNKIYVVGGNTLGHNGGSVNWFDEYNPATGEWTQLSNAPAARDHFQAVVIGNKLVVTGGRQTDLPNPFDKTVAATNIYNFDTQQWSTAAAIPTQRAGSPSVGVGNEVIVLGGEAAGQSSAFDVVEAYNVNTNSWRTLSPMLVGRHSGAAGIIGNRLHMVAGSGGVGGAPELTSHESLLIVGGNEPNPPEPVEEPVDEVVDEEPAEEPAEEPVDEVVNEEPEQEPVDEVVVEEPAEEPADEVVVEEPADEVIIEEPAAEPVVEVGVPEEGPVEDTADQSVTLETERESTNRGSSFGSMGWPLLLFMLVFITKRRRNHCSFF